MTIRGRHPRYDNYEGVPEEMVMQHQDFLAKREAARPKYAWTEQQQAKLDAYLSNPVGYPPEGWHSGMIKGPVTPIDPKLRPNFEGIGEDEDPDAYDRERDRRLTGEIP